MKITILALHLGFGGIEKFVSNIANMFEEDNEVEIISIYKLYDKPPFYINSNIKVSYLLEGLKPNRDEFYNSIKKIRLFEFIKQSYISMKILFLKKHKMKQAIKQIESDVVISTIIPHNKLLSKYGKQNIIKIATEHNYKVNDKKYINRVIKSCKNMNYLVIASKSLCKIYENKMLEQKCKVVNIPLALDYLPRKLSKLDEKNITYIGRLSEEKGVLDLIEVFKRVHKIDKDFKLNIVGDGELKEKIKTAIKENNLENNVIMYGYKTKSELEEIMLKTSIGINTSFTESFGLAIIETFSYGIPCVAFSSAEGTKDIIDNGENGYIIENRDWDEMANKIVDLIKDKQLLFNFGMMAKKKSLLYNSNVIKKRWNELIQN